MRRYLPFVIIALVLVAALGSGWLLYQSKQVELGPAIVAPAKRAAEPQANVPIISAPNTPGTPAPQVNAPILIAPDKPGAEPPHVRGGETALVTLEEFGDFQCPPCGKMFPTLTKLEHEYGSRLRVIFRHYPMRKHKHAVVAAYAAEAAGLQDRFWEMHDLLFQNSADWGKMSEAGVAPPSISLTLQNPSHIVSIEKTDAEVREMFAEYAGTLKLDAERFKSDLESEQVDLRLKRDLARATALGVDRTPTFFINGRAIPASSFTEAKLRAIIEAELKGQTPPPELLATPTPAPSP